MPITPVDAATLKGWLDKGEAVLVDVREPGEHAAQSIPGATLVPLATVAWQALPEFAGRKIVLHCKAGKRGGMACEKLLAENPGLEVYNLEGGIEAWEKAGYETRRSGKLLPLDQQVQLTIGIGVLLGVILGYAVSAWFLLLAAFFGGGLVNAGLTGQCHLASIMAKMPWNRGTMPGSFCKTR